MEVQFDLEYQDLVDTIDRMVKNLKPEKVEPELFKGAQTFAREIRKNAPVGPTGNLKKAVKTKKLQRWGAGPAPSIAVIDIKKAPHAFLVIRGTSGVRPVDPARFVKIYGTPAFITNTGVMPPNTFFQDSIRVKQDVVLYKLENFVNRQLDEGMK